MQASRILVAVLAAGLFPAAASAQFVLRNNNTGGDCQGIMQAAWNAQTRTCTLRIPLFGTIDILADRIVLDGAGIPFNVAPNAPFGVRLQNRMHVEVRNMVFGSYTTAIVVSGGSLNFIHHNTMAGAGKSDTGIVLDHTILTYVHDNVVVGGTGQGIRLLLSHFNFIVGNTLTMNQQTADLNMTQSNGNIVVNNDIGGNPQLGTHGINMRWGAGNLFAHNHIHDHRWAGIMNNFGPGNIFKYNRFVNNARWFEGLGLFRAANNLVLCNDFTGNNTGVSVAGPGAAGNQIWWNNFYANDTANDAVGPPANRFDQPLPIGGNYWQVNAGNCVDQNNDGICDAPYAFPANQDNFPHVKPIPWAAIPNYCEKTQQPPVPTDVTAFWDEWMHAHHQGSVGVLTSLLAADVAFSVGSSPDVRGRAAVAEAYRGRFPADGPLILALGDMEHEGTTAVIRGTVLSKSVQTGQFVMLLQKSPTGEWLVARLILFGEIP